MAIKLENSEIIVKLKSSGAELTSIKSKNTDVEYLWQGDSKIWNRHAPILFPIVGKLKDQKYYFENKEYSLPQHGFARDMDFELKDKNSTSVVFELKSNEETLKNYPFKFTLQVIYSLEGNSLNVYNKVINDGSNKMPFSIGAHPGFNCPLISGEKYEDYYLEFEHPQNLVNHKIQDGLLNGETEVFGSQVQKIPLTPSLFDNDALIFKNLASNKITLKTSKNPYSVEMDFRGFPYLGIWTKPGTSSFICIEPWYGVADKISSSGNILKKEAIQILKAGDCFSCNYSIKVS